MPKSTAKKSIPSPDLERRYLAAEARFKALFEDTPIPGYLWRHNRSALLLEAYNKAAAHMTEGRVADLVGKDARMFLPDSPHIVQDMNESFNARKTIRHRMTYKLRSTGALKRLD